MNDPAISTAQSELKRDLVDLSKHSSRFLLASAFVVPLIFFWAVCIHFLCNIPLLDDYGAVLNYLVDLHDASTLGGKLVVLLTHQHNEYKPVWAGLVESIQYLAMGQINFSVLSLLVDAQIMLLLWLLWRSFAPNDWNRGQRLAAFLPIYLMMLGINYAETLNWAMPGLQNIGVVTFALLSLWALPKQSSRAFTIACLGLVLCVAASGNGFFLAPVGFAMLLNSRRYRAVTVWVALTALLIAVYAIHYDHTNHSGAYGFHPLFFLSLMGSFGAVSMPIFRYGGILFGTAVAVGVLCAIWRRYDRVNLTMSGLAAFCLITMAGVSFTRGWSGIVQSLAGRYKLYPDLLLICLYSFGLHYAMKYSAQDRRRWYYRAVITACALYLVGNIYGIRILHARYVEKNRNVALYLSNNQIGPNTLHLEGQSEDNWKHEDEYNHYCRMILKKAQDRGMYTLRAPQ